jgi:thioredoxin-like negative regulator of GroEL
MTTSLPRIALAALAVVLAGVNLAHAQGRRGGGIVGNRGGTARPSSPGSPSFSHPAQNPTARPAPQPGGGNRPNLGSNFSPGNLTRPSSPPGGGANRPNAGSNFTPGFSTRPAPGSGGQGGRPNLGGNLNPGNRPGTGGIGERPAFGGIGPGNRPGGNNLPNLGGNTGSRPGPGGGGPLGPGGGAGNRPGGGMIGQRPGGNINRPQIGDHLGVANRPNIGNTIGSGNTNINRPININRPTNINTNINRPTNVVTNVTNTNVTNISNTVVNRPSYPGARYGPGSGGWGGGYGRWGGGYGAWGRGYGASPYAAYHGGWVNGFWNSHYLPGAGWGSSALGWGVGVGVAAWGVGSLFNSWGYSSFVNPYYTPTVVVQQPAVVVQQPAGVAQPQVYDYSRPIDVASPPPAQAVIDQSVASFDDARAAFKSGDYAGALKLADLALAKTPNDPMLHEFRATCLFALGRYDQAAAPLYDVLSAGPGWDWTTLAGLYSSVDVYSEQLRSLEAFCNANPQAASARFVLGSLYMTQGSADAAANLFKQVVALQPQDRLSAQLLAVLTRKPEADVAQDQQAAVQLAEAQLAQSQPAPATNTPATAQAADSQPAAAAGGAPAEGVAGGDDGQPPPLPTNPVPADLLGTWSASPAKDVTIALVLDQSKGFSWKVTDRGQSREFHGQATFDNGTLALIPPDRPPMVGTISRNDDGHFVFKAVGGPPNDPGLTFGKS